MKIIKEKNDIAVINIEQNYYVVRVDRKSNQVFSVMSSDMPKDCGAWFSNFNESGIKYVAQSRSRKAALAGFRRVVKEFGEY